MIETLIQFSFTIPEAINTVPHTGGVMVDNNANQKMNKCTNSISSPISTNAGPATETHIIYAAVVGTSIPRIKHAKAVKSNANQRLLSEYETINDVSFMPRPVIESTPIIIDAHKIIEAINEIWLPVNKQALKNLSKPFLKSNLFLILKKK